MLGKETEQEEDDIQSPTTIALPTTEETTSENTTKTTLGLQN